VLKSYTYLPCYVMLFLQSFPIIVKENEIIITLLLFFLQNDVFFILQFFQYVLYYLDNNWFTVIRYSILFTMRINDSYSMESSIYKEYCTTLATLYKTISFEYIFYAVIVFIAFTANLKFFHWWVFYTSLIWTIITCFEIVSKGYACSGCNLSATVI